jgi:phosphoribosylanthranilate isomerase
MNTSAFSKPTDDFMAVLLKICGITSLPDARYCAGAGVDMLGFIFHAESPRAVDPASVREIAGWIHGPEIVGVFVDADLGHMQTVAEQASLTMLQLHGNEPPELCARLDLPVIKAFRVRPGETAQDIRERVDPYRDAVRYILLDAFVEGVAGGTGETFDWDIARELSSAYPLLLSGGLNASNVEEAVATVRPQGIDLSSGVELRPGNKDFDLVADLIDAFANVQDIEPALATS